MTTHHPDCPNMATGVYQRGPYPCRCTPPAARWRRLLHIHWARATTRHIGPYLGQVCRCHAYRAVCTDGFGPITWSHWHPTPAEAVAEADALERLGGRPSWRELWRRSGRAG